MCTIPNALEAVATDYSMNVEEQYERNELVSYHSNLDLRYVSPDVETRLYDTICTS